MEDGPDARAEEASYESWSRAGHEATRLGDFGAALEAFRRAKVAANALDDVSREDATDLNVATVLIQMGRAREGEDGLREILLRSRDPKVAFKAAYNLAGSLRKQLRYERAHAYASRAMERARELDSPEYLAPAHNLLGNILLSQSYLDQALCEYETSLALRTGQKEDTRYSRAILQENIGYCLLLQKNFEAGLEKIRAALTLAEEVQDRRCRAECLQDLCYGLLLQGNYTEAIAMGEAALAESNTAGYRDIEENCHYLLGELGTKTGDLDRRDRHLDQLQGLHPELPFLKDFLCAVDVMSIITLKR